MTAPTRERLEEERFRQSLHERRLELNLSMGELARRMVDAGWPEFHQATISRIEKGQRPVRLGEARTLARILDQPLGYMLAADDESKLVQTFRKQVRDTDRQRDALLRAIVRWEDSKSELRTVMEQMESQREHGGPDSAGGELLEWAQRLVGQELTEVQQGASLERVSRILEELDDLDVDGGSEWRGPRFL